MTRSDQALNFGGQVNMTKFSFTYKDLAAFTTAGAKSIDLLNNPQDGTTGKFSIPPFGRILGVAIDATTKFHGGSLSALTASLGISGGSATAVLAAKDVWTAAAFFDGAAILLAINTAYSLSITFTPTGDTCSAATQGVLDVYVYWLNPTPA